MRASGSGSQQPSDEHQPIDAECQDQCENSQPISVVEGIPRHDEAMRLVVAIAFEAIDIAAKLKRLGLRKPRDLKACAGLRQSGARLYGRAAGRARLAESKRSRLQGIKPGRGRM